MLMILAPNGTAPTDEMILILEAAVRSGRNLWGLVTDVGMTENDIRSAADRIWGTYLRMGHVGREWLKSLISYCKQSVNEEAITAELGLHMIRRFESNIIPG